mgnify:FL=1
MREFGASKKAKKQPQVKARLPIVHLIDGNNWVNRAYYATPVLHTSDGIPTNGVKGFINMVNGLYTLIQSKKQVPYIVICFDIPRKETFRYDVFTQWAKEEPELVEALFPKKEERSYKGNRKVSEHTYEDLHEQIEICKTLCKLAGFTILDGRKINQPVEADDIIGTLAWKLKGCLRMIHSRDKDFKQLLTKHHIRLWQPEQQNSPAKLYTKNNMYGQDGLHPHQYVDYLIMDGDKVDNIAGIPGCGATTAIKLLDRWGSLDNIIEKHGRITGHPDRKVALTAAGVPQPVKIVNEKGKKVDHPTLKEPVPCPNFEVSRKLAKIKTDVKNVPLSLSKLKMGKPDNAALKRWKEDLEFNQLFWV